MVHSDTVEVFHFRSDMVAEKDVLVVGHHGMPEEALNVIQGVPEVVELVEDKRGSVLTVADMKCMDILETVRSKTKMAAARILEVQVCVTVEGHNFPKPGDEG